MPMFGWKKMGNAINPSAVGYQNKRPQVYGLAKLSEIDQGECLRIHGRFVDWYTLAFAAGGALLGTIQERWDVATVASVIGAGVRNQLPEDGECQSVFNALADVLVAMAGYQIALWARGKKYT